MAATTLVNVRNVLRRKSTDRMYPPSLREKLVNKFPTLDVKVEQVQSAPNQLKEVVVVRSSRVATHRKYASFSRFNCRRHAHALANFVSKSIF